MGPKTLLYALLHLGATSSRASPTPPQLLQYQRYTERSTFDGSRFYPAASNCDSDTLWSWANKCCANAANDALRSNATNSIPHWPRPELYNDSVCTYRVEVANQQQDVDLVIHQENCTANFSASKGGSSFHVLAVGATLSHCEVHDQFDDTYWVVCKEATTGCYNVTVKLDFEHFDAFAERGALFGRQYQILHKEIARDLQFCRHGQVLERAANKSRASGRWKSDNSSEAKFAWSSSSSESPPLFRVPGDRIVVFMGESHMRYNWDFIVNLLPSDADRAVLRSLHSHHSDAAVGNFSYKETIYARGFIQPIRDICTYALSNKRQLYTIVFQPGSWDATMWPSQQFIANPQSVQSLLSVLTELKRKGCLDQIRLVWVQQVPYPTENCQALCSSTRLARNNYAIAAMNTFIELELEKIRYPDLHIVRAFDIILPFADHFVCNNHFLCRPDHGFGMWQTPGGAAVATEIARLL